MCLSQTRILDFLKRRTSYAITDREGHSGIEEELFYSPAETKLP